MEKYSHRCLPLMPGTLSVPTEEPLTASLLVPICKGTRRGPHPAYSPEQGMCTLYEPLMGHSSSLACPRKAHVGGSEEVRAGRGDGLLGFCSAE